MDLRSFACFVAVADLLHFRRAAERLNLTQPALSQRIRVLEAEVGTPLFVRDRRNVALTPAGEAFLEPVRSALAFADIGKTQALRAVQGEVGRLRLGFTVIAFYGVVPDAVRAFRKRHPDVAIELAEMNSPLLEKALMAGEVDLAILHPPLATPQLAFKRLPDLKLVLALPKSHRLARKAAIRVAELAGEPLLIAPRTIGPAIFDRMIAMFQTQGFSPRIVQEVTPMTTLAGLVAAGVGLGFVTEGIARTPRPGVVFRTVVPEPPTLPLAAAWREPALSPTGERFLHIVAELAGRAGRASR